MAKQRHKKATKAAVIGTAIAATVGVGLTPTVANAVSSNTYVIGFPDSLPIGDGNRLASDPDTIYQTILDSRDHNPLVGWGTGGVKLAPQWVQWYNPNLGGLDIGDIDLGNLSDLDWSELIGQIDPGELTDSDNDQYYTLPEWAQTGTEDVMVDNPAYREAFEAALAQVMLEDREAILTAQTIDVTISYTVPEPSWWTKEYDLWLFEASLESVFGHWTEQEIAGQSLGAPITTTVTIDNPFRGDPEALDHFLETGEYDGEYPVEIGLSDLGIDRPSWFPNSDWNSFTIDVGDIDYTLTHSMFGIPGLSWDERAEDLIDPSIPQQIPETRPVFGWVPGYWTTNTYGQWISPTGDIDVLQNLDIAALLSGDFDLSSLSGLSTRDLAYFLSGDLGFLAPVLNWTAYLQNVNLFAYGDGAIATGEAYQRFIDAIRSGEIQAGEPQTDGMYIVINPDGNQVIRLVNQENGDITDYPLPDDLVFPDAPEGEPSYVETPGGVIDITLLTMAMLRNPGRPNGGLYARFAPIYQELTGTNPVSPERTDVLYGLPADIIAKLANGDATGVDLDDLGDLQVILNDANGKPMVITIKADATWEYDLLSDAPVTANPIAWANALVSSMLAVTYGNELLGIATGQDGADVGFVGYTVPTGEYDAGSFYATLTTESLPLLAPSRLVAGLIGLATGEDVNTPVADALEPLLSLLVDTSYTDVVRNADGTWSRTLDQMHVPTLFGTHTLTREQSALLAGDLIRELGRGVGAEFTDVVTRVTNRVVTFLEDNNIEVPTEVKQAALKFGTDAGNAIKTVGSTLGDGVSTALGDIEARLPDERPAPTQEQPATGQRTAVQETAKDGIDGLDTASETEPTQDTAAKPDTEEKRESTAAKRVTKTQKSLTRAQERADKVNAKLKDGDLKGAAKQVRANVKNRVDRLKKDINNGLKKVQGKDKAKDTGGAKKNTDKDAD